MLYLFGPKETDFVNGDSDLIHNTYDEVVERAKGFYLKFKVALDKDESYKKIKKEMIINAYTPDGWNQFRVFDIYNHSNHVEVVATHLHYDLNYKKVFPFVVNRATAQIALNVFVDNFKSDLPNFKFTSNITDLHSFSTDDDLERLDEGHNALEILNRIATRWGGELKVDGYNVHLTHKLGKFTNALLYEHKNISEFVDETSLSEIVTRIHAVSRFRPEREEGYTEEPEEVVIKVVVDSPLIDEYAQVYEEDYTNNDARTRDQLISWARLKYSTNSIDKPARSIKVETNIIDGQEINYGDDLVLKYTKHDVDEIIRCVGYQYNPKSKQYISVTLGSNMNSLASTITGSVHDSTKNQLSNIEKQVQIIKYAANNHNRVTTGPLAIPDPIEGDMWYYHPEGRPNDVELRIFQDGGWVTLISDMTGENVRRAIADLELEAEGLAEDIVASDKKADEAKETAGVAKSAAEAFGIITQETADKMVDVEQIVADAKSSATDALAEASEARTQAGQAFIDAQTAMGDAREAQTDASTAISNAATAQTDAQTAIDNAREAQTDATTSLTRAQSALDKATEVETTTSSLAIEVDDLSGEISLKADSSVVDTLKGTVQDNSADISANATAISQRVTTTTYNTGLATKENSVLKQSNAPAHLNGRLWLDTSVTPNILKRSTGTTWVKATPTTASEVGAYSSGQGNALAGRVTTAETNITQTSEALTSKADKSVVDTLSGTVSTHGTTLTQHATAISSKAAQTEVDTVKGTVATHTSTLSQQATAISARLTQSQVDNLVSGKGYSTVSYVDTQINTTAAGIRTEMTAIEGKIPTEIGGRNILAGTTSDEVTSETERQYDLASPLTVGWYVLSFYAKSNNPTTVTVYINDNSGQGRVMQGLRPDVPLTNTMQKVTVPIEITKSDGVTIERVTLRIRSVGFDITDSSVKLEKGNIATDWSPAPEDMMRENDFNTFKAEYDQSAQGWSSKLLQIEQAGYATKTWSNQTFATPQSVTTQLASYAKTTDLNGLATESYVGTQISTTAGAIRTEMTAVENKIPTEIGGRNLFTNSHGLEGISGTPNVIRNELNGMTVTASNAGFSSFRIRNLIDSHGDYTVSFEVRANKSEGSIGTDIVDIGGNPRDEISLTTEWQKYSKTSTLTDQNLSTYNFVDINFISTNGLVIEIRNFKFEKGSIPTDWSPAPEDMMQQNDFNSFKATYDQSAQGWNAKLLQIEQANYATRTWSNQTFATPQSVTTQLSSYAKTTALNGLATESYVGTQINTTAAGIRTEITAVENKIPTEIGGRNIIRGTSNEVSGPILTRYWDDLTTPLEVGNYQFQFIAKASVATPASVYFNDNSGAGRIYVGITGSINLTTEYAYYSGTIEVRRSDGSLDSNIVFRIYNAGTATITIAPNSLKVEKGDLATDWSPAPEDMMKQNDFNTFKAEYDQSAQGWSAKLLQIEQAGYATKTWSNQTFATPQSVTTQLSSYAKTTDLNGLATESYVGTQINTTAGTIRTEITEVEGKLLTQIGGRNYYKRDTSIQLKSGMNAVVKGHYEAPNGWAMTGVASNTGGIRVSNVINSTGYWTVSFKYRGTQNAVVKFTLDICDSGQTTFRTSSDNTWKYAELTVNVTNYSSSTFNFVDFDNIDYAYFRIDDFKVEKGNKATHWTLAPEDVATRTQVSEIKQTADSIQTLVGTTNDSVARAVMTSNLWETEVSKVIDSELEQQYKTVEALAELYRLEARRTLTAGTTFKYTRTTLPFSIVSGEEYVVEFTYPTATYDSYFYLHTGDLAHQITGNHTFKGPDGQIKITFTAGRNLPAGDQLAISFIDGRGVDQLWVESISFSGMKETQVPVVGTNTGAISSQITQLYDMINLSVLGKDGALSRIAMGEKGIQIDGKLLHITARTYIDDAVIKSAMIDSISAAKITTGTLNAANVKVINLDANSISGNEASFITAMFTASHSALQITGTGITVNRSNGSRTFAIDNSGARFYSDTGAGAYITTHNILNWTGTKWEDTGANSVMFGSELGQSIGIGYKIYDVNRYVTRSAIRLDRTGSGTPELQINLPIKNLVFTRGKVGGQDGSYLRNNQNTAGVWMGDNGTLYLMHGGEMYGSGWWMNQ